MGDWKPYYEWDLNETNLLPSGWDVSVRKIIDLAGMETILSGFSEQSREPDQDVELPVTVVTGDACEKHLPWLAALYKGELRQFVSRKHGVELYTAKDLRSSININCLRGVGARYETHVDTNTVTGVLFACDASPKTGGELVFCAEHGEEAIVWPRPGLFISFDGRTLPHYVGALKIPMDRISIPLNYYDDPINQFRPDGLDDRLYTGVKK